MMKRKMIYLCGVACLFAIGAQVWNVTARAAYESAPYTVVERDGEYEIREYPDLVLASTSSNPDARGNDGSFMRLFRYISGANAAEQKIAMTTPVFMEPDQPESNGTMGFVIPQEIAKSGPPSPTAADVAIATRKGGRFAVIRFSGVMTGSEVKRQETKLRQWMHTRGLQGEQTAERAGYDPPFTPPPLRRNEVLIRLAPIPASAANPANL